MIKVENSKLESIMEVKVAIESKDSLGEGPVWSESEGALYWVDIDRQLLQRWDSVSGERRIWEMPSAIGSFALRESGGCIVALRTGLASLDFASGEVVPIVDPEPDKPTTRFNDGKCDRQGRFWAGTMDEEYPNLRGSLYRLDSDLGLHRMRGSVGISNGLGWSPDNRTFYFTDSVKHTIYVYDFDPETGDIAHERIFAQTPEEYVPDGLTVDSEGCIWSAKWDGWKIVRYAPNGSIDLEVSLPVQRPTSCTFGGPGMNLLFVTSARIDLSNEELSRQPLAGSVFVIETRVKGIPEPKFLG
jgi:L-arabinonolactonase